jgi:uncharacterized protein
MLYVVAGILTGIIGGLFGVGGGEIFIPVLIYVFGFSQHKAQGTSLAVLLPPIGLLAALRYYHAGHVNFKVAMLLAVGFFVGAFFGAMGATHLNPVTMKRFFGRVPAGDLTSHDLSYCASNTLRSATEAL